MRTITAWLEEEHRVLEDRLDALEAAISHSLRNEQSRAREQAVAGVPDRSLTAAALTGGSAIAECLLAAAGPAGEHYAREAPFLDCLARYEPELAAKLRAQHEEACEIAAHFSQACAEGQTADMVALARRFHAIAQHNIIEEERDAFPLSVRCFTCEEQSGLIDTLPSRS